MSGVCGVIRLDGAPGSASEVEDMAAAVAFRASDGSSTWSDGPAALGQLSMWVTPEDEGQVGPYVDGEVVVVLDARLDNRDELASVLPVDAAAPDAAFVAAAYRRWGTACPERLIGDFAIVVWDRSHRRLVAARDPSGLRTLVYRHDPHWRLLLASEIRQLFAVPDVERAIDEASLAAHLCGPFVRPERTFYAGISQLPPGWTMELDRTGLRQWRFWTPRVDARMRFADEGEQSSAVRSALLTAVRDRCRSVMPVGLSLSGGIDSGAVACALGSLAADHRLPPVSTYSWAFEELASADERNVSDAIAGAFSFPSIAVPADDGYPLARWPEVHPHHDDPFQWPYEAVQQRTYASAAANGVKVLLSGSGGDETFGDWIWDYPGLLASGAFGDLARRLWRHHRMDRRSLLSLLADDLLAPVWRAYAPWPSTTPVARATLAAWQILSGPMQKAVELRSLAAEEITGAPRLPGSGRRLRYLRLFGGQFPRTGSADQLAHAEHGIVKADPLSDRRLVELVLSVPQYRVTQRNRGKSLLLDAVGPLRPKGVELRAGFVPGALWERGMRERSRGLVRNLLKTSRLDALGFTRKGMLAQEYERQLTGHSSFDLTWALGAELWLRTHWPEAA